MLDTDAKDGRELTKEGFSQVGDALKAPAKLLVGVSKILAGPISDAIEHFKSK